MDDRVVVLDQSSTVAVVDQASGDHVVAVDQQLEVHVVAAGQQGPQGVPGTPGTGGDLSHTHTQGVPLDTWAVTHNLGKFPSVSVVDSAGTLVEGGVQYIDANNVVLTFVGAFSGVAYFN
jgi:hypothetical protein